MRRMLLACCLVLSSCPYLMAHDFAWKNLLMASMKLNQSLDREANVDSYMQVFRPDVWKRYHNDEFEMAEKRKETLTQMAKAIDSFSLDETFVLRTTTTIGSYDFDKKQYPVAGWNESTYFYESGYPSADFPGTFKVFFENPEVVSGIPMADAAAKEFLRSRKDSYGNIDRTLQVVLYVRITKMKDAPSELFAEIQGGRIYADRNYTRQIHEFAIAAKQTKK